MTDAQPDTQPLTQPVGPDPVPAVTGRHPLSIGHLVMGVAFAGLTVVWALVAAGAVDGGDVKFLLPGPWVLAGAAGLVALVVTDRRRHGSRATGWVGLDDDPRPATDPPGAEPDDGRSA